MNQRHLWTIVALSVAVLGTPAVGRTQTMKTTALAAQTTPTSDVVKVGEFKSSEGKTTSDAVITSIHPHNIGGRRAATLFIRNIPVITFLSSKPVASVETKVGIIGDVESSALNTDNSVMIAGVGNLPDARNQNIPFKDDPVKRASLVATKINQLLRENVKADQITVSWKGTDTSSTTNQSQNKNSANQQQSGGDRYIIKTNDKELVEINQNTRLADSTSNLAQDALQATNRLRRLIGNASPIKEIANLPERSSKSSLNSIVNLPQRIASTIRLSFQGVASFYGYDGSGSQTASGERFNPEAMTAAHRSLPLGTKVKVTNTRNGRSVVVRINDRGPYIRGRIIDLSTGAARLLGMIGSGVAPVHIEVLGR